MACERDEIEEGVSKGWFQPFPYELRPGRTQLQEALRICQRDAQRFKAHLKRAGALIAHAPAANTWRDWLTLGSPLASLLHPEPGYAEQFD